ncbi:unnamed protein product [Trichogramma brassicae]|uniref:Uncharacterized protein n=1 Tax=Trichogramma brassicae TaxID=86971 RepID=A0A6H5IC86_9HYME|nr:unnamed protein product [Trichogramma brassicae]
MQILMVIKHLLQSKLVCITIINESNISPSRITNLSKCLRVCLCVSREQLWLTYERIACTRAATARRREIRRCYLKVGGAFIRQQQQQQLESCPSAALRARSHARFWIFRAKISTSPRANWSKVSTATVATINTTMAAAAQAAVAAAAVADSRSGSIVAGIVALKRFSAAWR